MNDAEESSHKEQKEAMTDITEHHPEQEGESHNREDSGVDFFVHRYTIGVDDLLEDVCEVICLDVCGRLYGMVLKPFNGSSRVCPEFLPQIFFSVTRAPEVTNVCSIPLPHLVNARINSLFLGYEPFVDFERARVVMIVNLDMVLVVLNLINLDQIVSQELP
jgi:hypothetical protein